jgi:hypothetical protein
MSDGTYGHQSSDPSVVNSEEARSLLDQLLAESRLYAHSKDYLELLDFVVRLREFAPFNAMLLQIQKPGLSYAASIADWAVRFERRPKVGARPLLILKPFGPVALVYDVLDTEGKQLPEDVSAFVVHGAVTVSELQSCERALLKRGIHWQWVDAGDRSAGSIGVVSADPSTNEPSTYSINMNKNHEPAVSFVTLAHELAHLFLGHLGPSRKLGVPSRPVPTHKQREIEAESVAYIVSHRRGLQPKSKTYLSAFVSDDAIGADLDVYQIMRAAGAVDGLLGPANKKSKTSRDRQASSGGGAKNSQMSFLDRQSTIWP